jgi:colanic acid/amylovoran biosynthesis glycosyltransferase
MVVGEFPSISETFVLNEITGLINRGHAVDIYAHFPSRAPFFHQRVQDYHLPGQTYYAPSPPRGRLWLRVSGASVFAGAALKSPTFFLRALAAGRRLREDFKWTQLCEAGPLLRHGPYDVIHCQFGLYGRQYVGLHKYGALKGGFVTAFRGYDLSLHLRQFGEEIYQRLFEDGDVFLPTCEYFKRKLIALGCREEKIVVHPSGVDCKKFSFTPRQASPGGRTRIVTIGRLVEKKGVEYAIRAIAKLQKEVSEIEYLIVGDGPLRGSFERMTQALEVGETIKLLGWKREDEVAEILRTSDVLLAPSVTSADGDEESIPGVLREAMAMGLPVVSTRHAGIPELIEDGVSGFLVAERDVEALISKLRFLITHPEIWPAMGHAGRVRVEEHYNIDILNDKLVDIYRALPVSRAPIGGPAL